MKKKDYNECNGENGGNTCSPKAICLNMPGSFLCSCLSGYFGTGFSCARNLFFISFITSNEKKEKRKEKMSRKKKIN